MKVALGGDHAGFEYKTKITELLKEDGIQVKDFGPFSDSSVDYPDFAHPLSEAVEKGEVDLGILICGSGNGVAISANKHQKVRAALCWNKELAVLARQHNDANVLCLAARFVDFETTSEIISAFLNTKFEGGRHSTRVNKISC
ncbi:MAG: ribose 5-phosphate isomerase B [Bacteroidota bacterium]|nr:ribose 5-phosphate isomerase B [Bacteroidota bacterium]